MIFRSYVCFVRLKISLEADEIVPTSFVRKNLYVLITSFSQLQLSVSFLFFIRFSMSMSHIVQLVGPSGLEPPTSCLSGTRSNLLSYEPMWLVWILFTLRLGFLFLGKLLCLPFFSKKVSGGDEGIRLSRELRAQSVAALTIINRHSLPLPFESHRR